MPGGRQILIICAPYIIGLLHQLASQAARHKGRRSTPHVITGRATADAVVVGAEAGEEGRSKSRAHHLKDQGAPHLRHPLSLSVVGVRI